MSLPNPFKPKQPVYPGMFAGRTTELSRCDKLLYEVAFGNQANILITGERAIGKTSLLLYLQILADGGIEGVTPTHDYLTAMVTIDKKTTIQSLICKIMRALTAALKEEEKALAFLADAWKFIKRIEIGGAGLKDADCLQIRSEDCIDELGYALSRTVKGFQNDNLFDKLGLKKRKDGILILIDEADSASDALNLGTFIKLISERLIAEQAPQLMFGVAGLPNVIDTLRSSHESSLRMFEQISLSPLSQEDVVQVAKRGLRIVKEKHDVEIVLKDDAIEPLYNYSEGYPHFVQQVCYSAFEANKDMYIDKDDVERGFFGSGGALDSIGNAYYHHLYYDKISEARYREILQIMSEKWNDWIDKKVIRKKFKGKTTQLDNGLNALQKRNIIIRKHGTRGVYRLQWASFAFWIRMVSEVGSTENKPPA